MSRLVTDKYLWGMKPKADHQKMILLQVILLALFPLAETGSWRVTVPRGITAFKASCLVIPCAFDYPGDAPETAMTAIWYKGQDVFFHSSRTSQSSSNRISLVGKLGSKNCSLLIKDIMAEDAIQLLFRIEIENIGKYSFSESLVTISLEANPPNPDLSGYRNEIKEGESVTMQCKTTHTCNVDPPTIVWTPHNGTVHVEHKYLEDGRWEVISRLVFQATHNDNKKPIKCNVQRKSGIESSSQTDPLNVVYAPKNTTISISSGNLEVKEGSQVSLSCSSDSNPLSSYAWYALSGNATHTPLNEMGRVLTIRNVTRTSHSYYCRAINHLGVQNSNVVHLNILYTAEISPESECQFKFSQFECTCVVQANPPPYITWLLPDRNVSTTEADFSFRSTVAGHVTKSHLKGTAWLGTTITCSASTTQGTAQLAISNKIDLLSLVLAAAVPGGILALVFALVACWYRRIKSGWQQGSTSEAKNKAKKSEGHMTETDLDSISDPDYVNVTIEEYPQNKKIPTSKDEWHPGGPYRMDWSGVYEEDIYQNC